MLRKHFSGIVLTVLMLTAPFAALAAQKPVDKQLLQTREAVWRAWFAGDIGTLQKLVPRETIVISSGERKWKNRTDVIAGAEAFHAKGGRLVRLEFPRTEVQYFGSVAVTYSQYVIEIEEGGTRSVTSGRATEIFVLRNGHWINPGWHTDEEH
jgi:hypothetical protein